jgi:hypothetical protein
MNDGMQSQGFSDGNGDESPLVDDPDAVGVDEDEGDPVDPSPKTDVPGDDEPDAPLA